MNERFFGFLNLVQTWKGSFTSWDWGAGFIKAWSVSSISVDFQLPIRHLPCEIKNNGVFDPSQLEIPILEDVPLSVQIQSEMDAIHQRKDPATVQEEDVVHGPKLLQQEDRNGHPE